MRSYRTTAGIPGRDPRFCPLIQRMTMREAIGGADLKGHELVEAFRRRLDDADSAHDKVRLRWRSQSPLAKSSRDNLTLPTFKLYVGGMEIANAFTELTTRSTSSGALEPCGSAVRG